MKPLKQHLQTIALRSANDDIAIEVSGDGASKNDSFKNEYKQSRNIALRHTAVENVQHLDAQHLLALQTLLQHGTKFGHWITPEKWCPQKRPCTQNVDLRTRINRLLPDDRQQTSFSTFTPLASAAAISSQLPPDISELIEKAVLVLTRYLVLVRIGPVHMGRAGHYKSLDPANIANLSYHYLPQLASLAISKILKTRANKNSLDAIVSIPSPSPELLGNVELSDLDALSVSSKKVILQEIKRMRVLQERGYWNDVPRGIEKQRRQIVNVTGTEPQRPPEEKVDSHLPLPNDYVSEMGWRSLWLIRDVGPNLITIAEEINGIWKRTESLSTINIIEQRRRAELSAYLDAFIWRDRNGNPIERLPFPIRLARTGKKKNNYKIADESRRTRRSTDDVPRKAGKDAKVDSYVWPPSCLAHVMGLIGTVQLANMFPVAMSMAGRQSEIMTLDRSCVQYARNGLPYANGRTFKLVKRHDGALRDWVLPDIAVHAIEQQVRLVTIAETIGHQRPSKLPTTHSPQPAKRGTHLWGQLSGLSNRKRSNRMRNLNGALLAYSVALGMDTRPGGQLLRPHRFRKTVGFIAGAALRHAPKILMDVFGHESIDMTLGYILTDPTLRLEIEQVNRELSVMCAKEVVEKIVAAEDASTSLRYVGGYGGPAAAKVSAAIGTYRRRLHRHGEEWGAESAAELADILTLQGKAWNYVRRGVICTKFPGTESGSCNKSKGHPEPARCQTDCDHRLEEAFLRDDVDGAIQDSLDAYKKANSAGDELLKALWAGQIRAHIRRFEDLRVKWMSDHTIRTLVQSTDIAAEL